MAFEEATKGREANRDYGDIGLEYDPEAVARDDTGDPGLRSGGIYGEEGVGVVYSEGGSNNATTHSR